MHILYNICILNYASYGFDEAISILWVLCTVTVWDHGRRQVTNVHMWNIELFRMVGGRYYV